ncbi:MAG: hypothetical protein EBR82_18305 [Caulobacteraceae bacterium]|nr:hypothetical protein [Caulobacteraceae bacterium]
MIDRLSVKSLPKPATELVDVPEWGGKIMVRPMNVLEQERFWEILDDAKNGIQSPAGKRGSVVMSVAMTEDGKEFFTPEDAEWIGTEADPVVIDRLFNAIQRLSGATPREQADIEKKPEITTNSSSSG